MKRLFVALVLVMAVMFVLPVSVFAGNAVATASWGQVITPDFDGWRLWVSDTQGGPYNDGLTYFRDANGDPVGSIYIPYGGIPGDTYTTEVTIVVPDGVKTTLYFVLNAWNSAGSSGDSNEAVAEFDFVEVPGSPFTLIIEVNTNL